MHHLIQLSGTPDEIKASLSSAAPLTDAYEQKLRAAVVSAVLVVLEECTGKASVAVTANLHSAENHPPKVSDEQMVKHQLGALQDGTAQSLHLTVTASLV